MADLLAAGTLGDQESPLQTGDQVLDRTTFPLGGPDHSADASRLSLLTAPLISLEGGAVGSQIDVKLLALGQQHLSEMFSLKAIRGFGRPFARIHIAR